MLFSCGHPRKNIDLQILNDDDFKKSCSSLEREIYSLQSRKNKIENKKNINNAKNFTFYLIAIPTAFMSLLFLSSDDDADKELYLLDRRIDHLNDLAGMNSCQNTTNIE